VTTKIEEALDRYRNALIRGEHTESGRVMRECAANEAAARAEVLAVVSEMEGANAAANELIHEYVGTDEALAATRTLVRELAGALRRSIGTRCESYTYGCATHVADPAHWCRFCYAERALALVPALVPESEG
jgi:cobalamin biosynthesis protein CbiD